MLPAREHFIAPTVDELLGELNEEGYYTAG
jgi:hypothetical protein